MALVDLQSNLSWYSSNGKPRGFRPNADRQSTRYTANEDSTFSVQPRGFDNTGFASTFPSLTTANEFYIDNTSTSFRGTSTRLNQQGQGTKFPTGPRGEEFLFDQPRTGFHFKNKYSDVYNSLTDAGLANTYVVREPINAMYNKFKVRDEAFNPGAIIRQPYILRGIQKDDAINPERFGLGLRNSVVDLPRGGVVTAIQRAKIDVERMTKFLTSTKGVQWLATQQLLHLMNTNRESSTGEVQIPIHANSSKVFTPLNFLKSLTNQAFSIGKQIRRHGQLDVDTPGFLPFPPSPPSNYEDIIKERNLGQLASGKTVSPIDNNRLVLIYRDLLRSPDGWIDSPVGIGADIPQLTAPFGPTSIAFGDGGFDIQGSAIRRWSITKPDNGREIPMGDATGRASSMVYSDLISNFIQWDFTKPYTDTIYFNQDEGYQTPLTKFVTDDRRGFKATMLFVLAPNFADTNPGLLDSQGNPRFNTSYDDIQKANDLRSNSGPSYDKIVDFRSYVNISGKFKHNIFDPYAKEPDTTHAAGPAGRQELLLTKLREDAKAPDKPFNGLGDSFRAIADNPPQAPDGTENAMAFIDPVTGKPTAKNTPFDQEYVEIGKAATARRENKYTDLDFRYDGDKKYTEYQTNETKDEIGIARQAEFIDGAVNPSKIPLTKNPALNADDTPTIAKYKTLSYDNIATLANKTKNNRAFIHYNRKQSGDSVTFWDGINTSFTGAVKTYNRAVTSDPDNDSTDLITFKFNNIVFRAYIDTISDSFSPGYGTESDQNRADPRYLYTSFERKVTISFKVVYEHASRPPWEKLKQLGNLTTPGYSDGPWGQGVFVTIGSLYKNVPMLIESLTYDWDNETPWSLKDDQANNYNGLPMYTQVQIGLIYLGDTQPKKGNGYVLYGG